MDKLLQLMNKKPMEWTRPSALMLLPTRCTHLMNSRISRSNPI